MRPVFAHLFTGILLGCCAAGSTAWSQENASYLSLDEVLSFAESEVIWNSESAGWSATINALVEASGAASSTGVASQSLVGNTVFETADHSAGIVGSFNGSVGVMAANQSSGSINNQANVNAIAIVGPGQNALHVVQTAAVQDMRGNTLETSSALTARIDNSFNDTAGIAAVNQAAGSLNQQLNVLALTFGGGAGPVGPIVADTALAQVGTAGDNVLVEDDLASKEQGITNSFNNFSGIAQGSSIAGNMNTVANLLSVSVQTVGAP